MSAAAARGAEPSGGAGPGGAEAAGAAPLTLGTAGHIDHGKTALIRAVTGVDTDRLPEERARGISIALGYASLELPSGRRLSVIDVPGHERFVRTMVAGATGVDVYLMAVAADDGVMPQTREHAAVLAALGVSTGVVAVTKSDIASPEVALLEAAELLPGVEAVAVSARTGEGLPELRDALERAAAQAVSRASTPGATRLHIDRAFTIKGAGTVVTGTLWSGRIARGDELRLLPDGHRLRVRGVQLHDRTVAQAEAGQRVAVNVNAPVRQIERGDVLAGPEAALAPSWVIDAELRFEGRRRPEHGDRVQVHHGTREAPARLHSLGGRFWQLRLQRPLLAAAGDRLVVRRIAPPDTLGGGSVLDPRAPKHGPSRDLLVRLERLARGEAPASAGSSAAARGAARLAHGPAPPSAAPGQPGRVPGRPAADPPPGRVPAADPPGLSPAALALERRLREARFEPPLDSELEPGELAALRESGRAVRVSRTLHYHPEALAEARRLIVGLAERHGGAVTLAQVRDELATSRKFAQALLERLDAEKVTVRRGEAHALRRGARPAAERQAGRAFP